MIKNEVKRYGSVSEFERDVAAMNEAGYEIQCFSESSQWRILVAWRYIKDYLYWKDEDEKTMDANDWWASK